MNNEPEALWGRLQRAGVVKGAIPAATEIQSPWYVRAMLGVTGWMAAGFLLGFVAVGMKFVIESETASITLGALALLAAYAIFRSARNDFHEQFGLAVSFAGQVLIMVGLLGLVGSRGSTPWWLAAALQVLVATVMPNFIQRLVAGFLAAFTLSTALAFHGAPFVVSVLVTLIIGIIWLNEFHWRRRGALVRPVGYGLTLALVQLKGQLLFDQSLLSVVHQQEEFQILMPLWLGELATGLLLIAVVARLLWSSGASWTGRPMLAALVVAAVVAAVSLEAPGIATGFTVILLGFANGNRVLTGLGIAALLFYISAYYYSLEATLLTKSEILAATGATLLLARWVVLRWVLAEEESSHAG